MAWDLAKFLLFSVLIIGLAYFTARGLGHRLRRLSGGRHIRIREVTPLGPGKSLCLAQVGARRLLLLGVSDRRVNLLATLTPEELEGMDPDEGPGTEIGHGPGDDLAANPAGAGIPDSLSAPFREALAKAGSLLRREVKKKGPGCLGFLIGILLAGALLGLIDVSTAHAAPLPLPRLELGITPTEEPREVAGAVQILLALTVLSLAPAILILMTSFTRIVVVLSFVRNALGTQQVPPNQVLVGLALFVSLGVMAPVWGQVNENALQPYLQGGMSSEAALAAASEPVRGFMLRQTREKDLALFMGMGGIEEADGPDQVPTHLVVPAFVISELKTAFQIGFMIYVPFIMIDMIVASTLMSMGMLMLPPVMISLPFKVLLFVLVDGWHLVVQSLVGSFS